MLDFSATEEVQKAKKPATLLKRSWAWIILAVLIIGGISSAIFLISSRPAPAPQLVSLADNISFPVYYPSTLPHGYSYIDNSAKIQSGLIYYKLHNGTKVISVTQQPISSPSSVNLQKLPRYSSLNVPAGPAAIGVSIGNPAVVILTGSTLVNINSSKGVSKDSVIAVARNMKAIDTSSTD
jgi:hypothetical protein